jgi:hypothetical protein
MSRSIKLVLMDAFVPSLWFLRLKVCFPFCFFLLTQFYLLQKLWVTSEWTILQLVFMLQFYLMCPVKDNTCSSCCTGH